ncbi:MAG: carbonic anhydrase [Vicinamibacterales bacterium]
MKPDSLIATHRSGPTRGRVTDTALPGVLAQPGVKVAVVTCCDAHAPAGEIFGSAGAAAMAIRTVGNTIGEDVLGALEYACVVEGAAVIVILGHSHCHAVSLACKGTELGHLTGVLDRMGPAIRTVRTAAGDGLSTDALVERVTAEHARRQAEAITARSPLLAALVADGQLTVIAAVADSASGTVVPVQQFRHTPSAILSDRPGGAVRH